MSRVAVSHRLGAPQNGRMGQADYGFPQPARLAIAFSSKWMPVRVKKTRQSMQRSGAGIAWPSLKISTEKNF
jgi:hypothetical protein